MSFVHSASRNGIGEPDAVEAALQALQMLGSRNGWRE